MTEIHYEVREKDLIAFNEHLLGSNERVQKIINRHQAMVPAIIAVIALILFFVMKDIPSAIYAILLSMAWGLGVPFFLKWSMRKQIRQSYSDAEKANLLGHYSLRPEAGGLVETNANGESSKVEWKNVLRTEVEKKYIFVFVALNSATTALIIPRDTLPKTDNLHEFVKSVDEYIEKAS
jgi:hypothetical protein